MSSQTTDRRQNASATASVIDQPTTTRDGAGALTEDRDTLVKLFHQMLLIRRFEEKCAESYSLGKIGGFCHLYIGQEAVGVGAISALRTDDYVITSYREHGQALAKGMSPDAVMAELYGKATGCSKGQGRLDALVRRERELSRRSRDCRRADSSGHRRGLRFEIQRHRSSHGLFLRRSRRQSGRVSRVAEHGAALEASLHLHLRKQHVRHGHFAATRDVFPGHCRRRHVPTKSRRNLSMAWMCMAVREATQRAVERARKESLPTLLEVRTYRFMGHSMSDPGNYRTRAEIEKYQERDPIKLFRARLEEKGMLTDDDVADDGSRSARAG